MTARCSWQDILTGQALCDRPATYRIWFEPCPPCQDRGHATCQGADVCGVHTADVRRDEPGVARVVTLAGDR